MSRNYEMMYILRPDLSEEQIDTAVNRYRDFLSEQGAENIQIQNRGKRRLAYPIKKYLDGTYIQMNYQADGKQVAPLERAMRLGEEVIRYLTIKLKDESMIVETETTTTVETPTETETETQPTPETEAETETQPTPETEAETETSEVEA